MSSQNKTRSKITIPKLAARKGGEPIVCLTAYSAPMAALMDDIVDVILVGDSVGMVVHGMPDTIGVTLEMMILHGAAAVRGAKRAPVVIDLPFGSYQESPEQAYRNSARVLQETGAEAVKIEGGRVMAETVRFLVDRGIPVMGHVGLQPQSVHALGGYKAQGRQKAQWADLVADAKAIDDAGAFTMVIEGVAEPLAAEITGEVRCPTIGIGASDQCDGQVLVIDDLLGMADWSPSFVKRYAELSDVIRKAVQQYADEVRARRFPTAEHVYKMKE